jgi:hypothetical protein
MIEDLFICLFPLVVCFLLPMLMQVLANIREREKNKGIDYYKPISQAKSTPNSITPWKYVALVCGGIGALILLAWSVAVLSPPSPQPTNISSQFTQTPVSNTPTRVRQLVSTVKRTTVICGNSCKCSPVAGTINMGTQVTVLETADCSGRTWYRIGKRAWLAPGLIDNSAPEAGLLTADNTTRPPTPTRRLPTPTTEPLVTNPDCEGGCIEYPSWCAPPIKGNVSYETDEKIYHVPGQEYYDETKIRPDYGERWFCTEQEARSAGWRKSRR